MADDLTQLLKDVAVMRESMTTQSKDMAEVKSAIVGTKINGTVVAKGILARLDRLEKGFLVLAGLVLTVLGITGGSTIVDWLKGL